MPKVLVIIDYYLPGFKAGGPQRTLQYLVDSLGDEIDFKILTRDRDLGDTGPYPNLHLESWQPVGKGWVFYIGVKRLSLKRLRRILLDTEHDILYLNSLFAPPFTLQPLLLRRLGLIGNVPVILRPRGELNKGAVAIKSTRKRLYMALTKLLGLYKGIVWHASSECEVEDVRRHFGMQAHVVIAANIPKPQLHPSASPGCKKIPGQLKIVFLSRISHKKNLEGALRILDALQGQIEFNIYGPIEDAAYWNRCQEVINSLPGNISVTYQGAVTPDRVLDILQAHHLFFFPTFGENFGHVIFESLAAGCPVLLSDRTPWSGLREKGCGWEVNLDEPDKFRECLKACVEMDNECFIHLSERARECALDYTLNSDAIQQNRLLLVSQTAPPIV